MREVWIWGIAQGGEPPWHLDTGYPQGIMASPQKRRKHMQNLPFLPQKCSITGVLGEISIRKKFFKELGQSSLRSYFEEPFI